MSHPSRIAAGRRWSRRGRIASTAVVVLAATGGLVAHDDATASPSSRTAYGAAVTVGEGTARGYIVMDGDAPTEIGVALSERALAGLPAGHDGGDPHAMMHEYLITLPAEAEATAFSFVGLNWNPMGHEPDGVYTVPHFDFHFYTIPVEQRATIAPTDPQWAAKAARLPEAEFAPPGYLAASALAGMPPEKAAVPLMGMHWLDPQSEELHGKPFQKTFIYGSWDGKLIFAEPMITKAYLETKPDFSAPLAVPPRSTDGGLRATAQRIYWNQATSEYRVALTHLAAPTP
ncbi:MAG: DUF5602 domain-containing protein [Gemmatimonadaceae bacterium]